MNYYNEHDNFAADWLENLIEKGLIPDGKVDRRSIADVQADDVRGFTQCHFFAGIGGWPLALQLAGWGPNRPVWTGSCPCQPFSQAGKQKGQKDERHLWPEMFRLIRECQPVTVFGEQVASAIGHGWLDGISDDLEGENYAVGSIVLGAFSVCAPHKRSRLFWVANSHQPIVQRVTSAGEQSVDESDCISNSDSMDHSADCCRSGGVADSGSQQRQGENEQSRDCNAANKPQAANRIGGSISLNAVGDTSKPGLEGRASSRRANERPSWSASMAIDCLDGKSRRVGCGVQPLVNGIPRSLGRGKPELSRLAKRARANRVGRLKGYGNAIVPQVAAEFVMAFMDCRVAPE